MKEEEIRDEGSKDGNRKMQENSNEEEAEFGEIRCRKVENSMEMQDEFGGGRGSSENGWNVRS
jgi:hypothetical protein